MIGAHPDDCEIDGGGTAILMASIGHSVKFVSITTGDAGHLESRLPVLQDGFQRPKPFRPDIVVDITAVTDNKIHAMAAHESQFFEWLPWIGGYAEEVPKDNLQWEPWLKKRMEREMPEDLKKTLDKWYGAGTSGSARFVEAFEICEYGKQPSADELRKIFPMLDRQPVVLSQVWWSCIILQINGVRHSNTFHLFYDLSGDCSISLESSVYFNGAWKVAATHAQNCAYV